MEKLGQTPGPGAYEAEKAQSSQLQFNITQATTFKTGLNTISSAGGM